MSFPLLNQNCEAVYSHLDNPPLWRTFHNDLASLSGNDYDTETDIDTDTYIKDINEGRKRRHKALPNTWKRNKAKLRRMQGVQYLGYSKPANRKILQDTLRSARIIGERCKSDYCVKSKLRECSKISEDCRKQIQILLEANELVSTQNLC
ncbi:unnamed protein product [Parnassius apollo]|uniref:(apollo) hypothetical protein n=1 Tax=Parnassius apollo TaxID=110799 RepID=A0A8S3XDK6_PARAO|nr:unnamed protein product [Parnassius apollo]